MKHRLAKILNFVILSMFFVAACTAPSDTDVPAENMNEEETVIIEETQEDSKPEEDKATPTPAPEEEEEEMQSNKVLVVVARDRYQSLEFNPVADELKAAGYEAVIASDELGTAMGTTENTEVDIAFTDINTADYIAIVLIGGSNSLWYNEELHALLNPMNDEGKLVAAICYGSVTLATGEVLGEGDSACWYNSGESDPVMDEHGVSDTGMDVTISGNIITGDGPNAAEEFAKAVVDYLK